MINFLPDHAITAIDRYHRKDKNPNRTRFYLYLMPFGDDMEIHTVAVKTRKDGTAAVKEVCISSVDNSLMYVRDIVFYHMAGYMVDWSHENLNNPHRCHASWGYDGRAWASVPYNHTSGLWKLYRSIVNPEALQAHPRFKYCSWNESCGHILDYLKSYAKHPKIELLAKIGAGRFTTKTGFLSQIEKDKGLMRFFMANLADIKEWRHGIDAIRIAYKRGITLEAAGRRIRARNRFRGYGLPASIDAMRAHNYIEANTFNCAFTYCQYLKNCLTLGMDLSDTKVIFPKQFKRRNTIVSDQIKEIERRKNAELAKVVDNQIAEVAKKFSRLEKSRGMFRLVLPRKAADLVREGKRMSNCLGSGNYVGRIARGEAIIAFIRHSKRPGAAFVAVEYSPDQKRVLQCYGANNSTPPAPVLKFVNRVFPQRRRVA